MIEARELVAIIRDVEIARTSKLNLRWTSEEIACDMLVIARQLIIDLENYLNERREAPAKRIRRGTKILETLGKSFRVQSVIIRL